MIKFKRKDKEVVHQRRFELPRPKARAPQARVSTVPPLVHFDNLKRLIETCIRGFRVALYHSKLICTLN